MAKTVGIAGGLDTKGTEFAFVKELIEGCAVSTLLVDFGVLSDPANQVEIGNRPRFASRATEILLDMLKKNT